MSKIFLFTLMMLVVALSLQACAPGQPTPDMNTIYTAVAQTMAAATQTAGPGIPVTGDETPTPTATPVPTASPTLSSLPTVTAAPTDTAVPAQSATPVFTPGVAQLYVSLPTNCRLGPSVSYTRVGGLPLGQVANIVGRNATGDYWIIRNPQRASEVCWLWGRYAVVSGDTSGLPVFSPPPLPTPTPKVAISLSGVDTCPDTGTWWPELAVENTGGVTFESFFMTLTDTTTGTALSVYQDDFIDRNGCSNRENQGSLDPQDTFIISAPAFSYDPSGHPMHSRLTLCTGHNQNGTCITQNFDFTP
jgi:hypothetical protein